MSRINCLICYAALSISLVQAKFFAGSRQLPEDVQQAAQYTVDLPVDHWGSNTDTFANRYFINDQFYKDGGPVILLDGGEYSITKGQSFIIPGRGTDAICDYAERFGGLLILWEHRYYGESYPNYEGRLETPDDLAKFYQYLTIEQALEDVVFFAKSFSLPTHEGRDLRPHNTPWIFIGGSYPGIRAAYLRERNPAIIYASLASSAPLQLQENFWQYYVAVERKLAATPGYESCLRDTIAFAQWVTQVVDQKSVQAAESFLQNAVPDHDASTANDSKTWWIRSMEFHRVIFASMKSFQNSGVNMGSLKSYCSNLRSGDYTKDGGASVEDLKDGIVAHYGLESSLGIWAVVVHDLILELAGPNSRTEERTGGKGAALDALSWCYQVCAELGFFQVGNTSRPTNIIPGFETVKWYRQLMCRGNFGKTLSKGPDTQILNDKYHGWKPTNATNTFFVNGEYDPWRALSIDSDIDPSTPANIITTRIPPSRKSFSNAYFGYTVKNGLHCSDLTFNLTAVRTNNAPADSLDVNAAVAHEIFASALSSWLPDFTPYPAPAANPTRRRSKTNTGVFWGHCKRVLVMSGMVDSA